jgi:succinate dehydrogenase/fumarate reductase flavoprotein subunit
MTNDDHAALIEVKHRLAELSARQSEAKDASDWTELLEVQAKIEAADAELIEIMRRTEPEDEPRL